MRIIGCDLHARQQTLAMLDTATGELVNQTLTHEGNQVREFYAQLPRPVRVGIEATGSMHWFVNLLEELGIECQIGDAAKIRAAEPRKQKHDRRDAELILKLLVENRFPAIWRPTKEQLDLRALLLHRVNHACDGGRRKKDADRLICCIKWPFEIPLPSVTWLFPYSGNNSACWLSRPRVSPSYSASV
ncbi:MAG TPA: transposase [Terriglobales bacterium]|nr:transposase [Terriglobales bacterium]